MKRDEGGENRPSREELEGMSFDDLTAGLADGTITRAKAIKLAGAALLGGALTVLWADEADALNRRRRRRKKRRRRRKAQVTPTQVPLPTLLSSVTPFVFTVTNPSDDKPLTISGFQVLGGDGTWGNIQDLPDVTIQVDDPNTPLVAENVGPVAITVDPQVFADAEGLRLVDASNTPITVVDENGIPVRIFENGVQVGTGYIDVV